MESNPKKFATALATYNKYRKKAAARAKRIETLPRQGDGNKSQFPNLTSAQRVDAKARLARYKETHKEKIEGLKGAALNRYIGSLTACAAAHAISKSKGQELNGGIKRKHQPTLGNYDKSLRTRIGLRLSWKERERLTDMHSNHGEIVPAEQGMTNLDGI